MNTILKEYYHINLNINNTGYFYYNNEIYYLYSLDDINSFYTIYQLYRNYMNELSLYGYDIVLNIYNEYYSGNYVLLRYRKKEYLLSTCLIKYMQPLAVTPLFIHDIKEQWIQKIDDVRHIVSDYVFKEDHEVLPVIQYYLGIGETCITLLNEILLYNKKAMIPLSLSLKYEIPFSDEDLLNPCHYMISSRPRLIVNLLKSKIINISNLSLLFQHIQLNDYEYIYLIARLLYPSLVYNKLINHTFSICDIYLYKQKIEEEIQLYKEVYKLLESFISLPKISWINH